MKSLLTALLILSVLFSVCAQSTGQNIKKIIYNNKNFYNYASKFIDKVNVKDLKYTKTDFYFRFYGREQLIDI